MYLCLTFGTHSPLSSFSFLSSITGLNIYIYPWYWSLFCIWWCKNITVAISS